MESTRSQSQKELQSLVSYPFRRMNSLNTRELSPITKTYIQDSLQIGPFRSSRDRVKQREPSKFQKGMRTSSICLINELNSIKKFGSHAQKLKEDSEEESKEGSSRHKESMKKIAFRVPYSFKLRVNFSLLNRIRRGQNLRRFYDLSYSHKQVLGHGVFSEVRICTLRETKTEKVVKVFRKKDMEDPQLLHQFVEWPAKVMMEAEHQGIGQVDHVFVTDSNEDENRKVKDIYEAEQQSDHIYVVSDYYEGGSLFQHIIGQGVLGEEETRQFVLNILHALRYLHEEMGVAVGNLNPEAIAIDKPVGKFATKLINFSFGLDLKKKEESHLAACGNLDKVLNYLGAQQKLLRKKISLIKADEDQDYQEPEKFSKQYFEEQKKMLDQMPNQFLFLAPEQVLLFEYNRKPGDVFFDGRQIDLWALGAVILNMVNGVPPIFTTSFKELERELKYAGNLCAELEELVVGEAYGFSADLLDFVRKCLQPNPKNRMKNVFEALNHPWLKDSSTLKMQIPKSMIKDSFVGLKEFSVKYQFLKLILYYSANFIAHKDNRDHSMRVFQHLDHDGTGYFSKEDLISVLEKHSIAFEKQDLFNIFHKVSMTSHHRISFSEFVAFGGGIPRETLLSKECLKVAFDLFDLNSDKLVSIKDLRTLIKGEETFDSLIMPVHLIRQVEGEPLEPNVDEGEEGINLKNFLLLTQIFLEKKKADEKLLLALPNQP